MIKPIITGSFMDIQHVNNWDAQYWIDQCREWKDKNWEALIKDMFDIGIDTVLITGCALWGRPLYPADIGSVGLQLPMGSKDPLGRIIKTAGSLGMDVYAGLGFFGRNSMCYNIDLTPEHDSWLINMAEDILDKYSGYKSLKGLYLSSELSRVDQGGLFKEDEFEETCKFVYNLRKSIGRLQLVTSPDNLGMPGDWQIGRLTEQLRQMDIDVFAYQDHAGFNEDYEKAAKGFEVISKIHHGLNQQLWANCEVFSFRKRPDGRNVCIPSEFERIRRQLLLSSQYADKIIIYQYQGIMNKMTDLVNIGHPDSQKLYGEYMHFLGK
jgi:hypothetical protein